MGRLPSLKTVLLVLICVGVLLILVFISQCQKQNLSGVFTAPQHHALLSDKEMDYYRGISHGGDTHGHMVDDLMSDHDLHKPLPQPQPRRKIYLEKEKAEIKFSSSNLNTKGPQQQQQQPEPIVPQQDVFKGDYNFPDNFQENEDKEMEVYHEVQAQQQQQQQRKSYPIIPIAAMLNEVNIIPKDGESERKNNKNAVEVRDISCDINSGRYIIPCKATGAEVYVPFSFIEKEFEISGHLDEKTDTFLWLHSQAKIIRPKGKYNPTGVFTYFENYQVESRDRVKCISGKYGVPISTQWSSQGYFYPIQIAQFGLSHFSKFLAEGEPHRLILEDAEDIRANWVPNSVSLLSQPVDSNDVTVNNVVQLDNSGGNVTKSFTITFDEGVVTSTIKQLVLSLDMKISRCPPYSSSFGCVLNMTVTVRCDSKVYYLHYVNEDYLIEVKDNRHFFYGLGHGLEVEWQHFIRDVHIDTQKGVSFKENTSSSNSPNSPKKGGKSRQKIPKSKVVIDSLTIYLSPGMVLLLDNLTISNAEHMAQFYQAADWFVLNQDEMGGWPIPVKRKFSSSDFPAVLEPGWNSAMSQGHALSLLSRAYYFSNSSAYKNALIRAVSQIFELTGPEKGVRTTFLDQYVWYEEYPTTPSSFVLNGFMYALLGLYDLKMVKVSGGASDKAGRLYDEGIQSLKMMLPLFDTGSGTMYDLRHFTVPGVTPNLARIDYHVTHINQLLTFATFDEDPIFKSTAERWIGYTQGRRAPHN